MSSDLARPSAAPSAVHRIGLGGPLDDRLDEVLALLNRQMCDHGLTVAELHFGRSRVACWYANTPYDSRLFTVGTFLRSTMPTHPYPRHARLHPDAIADLWAALARLRWSERPLIACTVNLLTARVALRLVGESYSVAAEELLAGGERPTPGLHHGRGGQLVAPPQPSSTAAGRNHPQGRWHATVPQWSAAATSLPTAISGAVEEAS